MGIFEDRYLYRKIDNEQVCKVLDILISYILRRMICDLPTNSLNKVFASLSKDIGKEKYDKLSIEQKVGAILVSKKGKASFPNNNMLKECFINKDFYNFKQDRFVLEEIEGRLSKEKVNFDELSIEHIMPQTLSPIWQVDLGKRYKEIHEINVHKVGNLTLTGYNSEMSNKSYSEKREFFSNSNVTMNRKIAESDEWNEKQICDRGIALFDQAIEIWEYPKVDDLYMNQDNESNEFDIMDDVNVTGKSPYEIVICGSKYSVDSWRGFFSTICKVMYEYDGQIFRSLLMHNDFKGKKRRIITRDKESLMTAQKIAEGIYIEQHFSANDTLNYSKLVVEKYDDMEDEISYKIR